MGYGRRKGALKSAPIRLLQAMNQTEKRWWVSYVVARLAPFANVFGFVYSWETGGRGDDLHLAQLLHEFDIFRHMVTYEDANAIASNWHVDCRRLRTRIAACYPYHQVEAP